MYEKPTYIQEDFFSFYIVGGLYDAIPPIACLFERFSKLKLPDLACPSDCLLARLICHICHISLV